jgi:hypothetical protein
MKDESEIKLKEGRHTLVIPAKAGIQQVNGDTMCGATASIDPRLRGDDKNVATFLILDAH